MWRESASLILAAKSNFCAFSKFNYKLLCLQRSSNSKILPDTYVFPGGHISKSDSSPLWINFFEKFGYNLKSLEKIQPMENVPSALRNDWNPGCLPNYLSLRICAIRETFEECGILICKSSKIKHNETSWASYIEGSEIIKWQNEVHNDPDSFLNLCTELDAYPDIWSLHLWSNWATPHGIPSQFNTIFFFSSFNQIPSVHPEINEIQNVKWDVPDEYIEENRNKNIILPAPQFYEISRLGNFSDINLLSKYAKERSYCGCEKYLPYRIKTKDEICYILPGDEMYSENIETDNMHIQDASVGDDIPQCKRQNRLFQKGQHITKFIVKNILPKDGHVTPKMKEN